MKELASKAGTPNKWMKGAMKVERSMLSTHYCEDSASCEALDDLTAHRERLKDKGKNAFARVAGRVSQMLSGDEGSDDEELEMHDRETGERERMKVGAIKGAEL